LPAFTEWDTKESPGKFMKNALYVQQHGKNHLSGWSNIKQQKIKPVALAIVKLREFEGISQSVSQAGRQADSYLVVNQYKILFWIL